MREMRPAISAAMTTDSFAANVPTARMSSYTVSTVTRAVSTAMAAELCWLLVAAAGLGDAEIEDNERKSIKNQTPKASNMSAPIADQNVVLRLIFPRRPRRPNKNNGM